MTRYLFEKIELVPDLVNPKGNNKYIKETSDQAKVRRVAGVPAVISWRTPPSE